MNFVCLHGRETGCVLTFLHDAHIVLVWFLIVCYKPRSLDPLNYPIKQAVEGVISDSNPIRFFFSLLNFISLHFTCVLTYRCRCDQKKILCSSTGEKTKSGADHSTQHCYSQSAGWGWRCFILISIRQPCCQCRCLGSACLWIWILALVLHYRWLLL